MATSNDILISVQHLVKEYDHGAVHALNDCDLDIRRGEFVAVLGANGCGKSTLAKHFNAILLPESGKVYVEGMDTADDDKIYDIRQTVGMVFQNPDNQIVANVVEEDVAFAPENLGVPTAEIRRRVDDALAAVGMTEFARHAPHLLSGGQKQRVAIAGVIAMEPQVLVLDEPTAGLDPEERIRFRGIISDLSQQKLVLLSTHIVSDLEAVANEIILLRKGVVLEMQKPSALLERLNGQVWIVTVPAAEEAALTKQYACSNVLHTDGKSVIRLLSESAPRPDAVPTAPNMEDLYLYYFGR